MNQLYVAYARGKEAKELAAILGEAALTETGDKLFADFADRFEEKFINQGEYEDRSIVETLEIGWELMAIAAGGTEAGPDEYLEKYLPAKEE